MKDLLNPFGRDSLPVRWSKDKGFYVENLFVVECETTDDILAVLEEGMYYFVASFVLLCRSENQTCFPCLGNKFNLQLRFLYHVSHLTFSFQMET